MCPYSFKCKSLVNCYWNTCIFGLCRNFLSPKKQSALGWGTARNQGPGPSQAYRGRRGRGQHTDPGALQKITVLESELMKLRAQIAMIVSAAPSAGRSGDCLQRRSEHMSHFLTRASSCAPFRSDGASGFPWSVRHVSCPGTGSHVYASLCPSPSPATTCTSTSSSLELQRREFVCIRADPAT